MIFKEMVNLFEYRKNNEKYWDDSKLYKQVVTKAFSIAKAVYLKYLLLFLFDYTTSHSIYINNIFYTIEINKKSSEKLL